MQEPRTEASTDTPGATGQVVAIHVAPEAGAETLAPDAVLLVAGKGIEGDRYFSRPAYRGVTLVSEEAVQSACEGIGAPYRVGATRRNVTVRGLDVMTLLDREFRLGSARLRGTRPCEPCDLMETTVGTGAREALVRRAGIRCEVLEGGNARVGDTVVPL